MKSWKSWLAIIAITVLLFYLYGICGSAQDVDQFGHSAVIWLTRWWGGWGSEYSYGWLIPVVSLVMVWLRRKDLVAAPKSIDYRGLAIVVFSLFLHWLGMCTQQTRVSLVSLIGLLWGIPFYLQGPRVARILLFPCAYLILCLPPAMLDALTGPLRIFASSASTVLLNGLGIPAIHRGTLIASREAGVFQFGVDDPCSGMQSLLAIAALTSAYAYFLDAAAWKKWLLFFSALPLAIIGNIGRIVGAGIVAFSFGSSRGIVFYHDYSGYLVFAVAVAFMMGISRLLARIPEKGTEAWTREHKPTPLSQ